MRDWAQLRAQRVRPTTSIFKTNIAHQREHDNCREYVFLSQICAAFGAQRYLCVIQEEAELMFSDGLTQFQEFGQTI